MEEKFLDFHADNPHVYARLARLAKDGVGRGHRKLGMKMLFEVLRWQALMRTTDPDFKLNNNYTAFYARLLMERESDLADVFELREQRSHSRWLREPAHVPPDTLF